MRWLITGGAGFIGTNLASRLLEAGHDVIVLDDLSRAGSELNLRWLQQRFDVPFVRADVRDADAMVRVFRDHPDVEAVAHQAAQVAVTTSIADPREDFEVNLLGTFNLLEAARPKLTPPALLFASTNKVYGSLGDTPVRLAGTRYEFERLPNGVPESWPLDFHAPYGCSKGAADQYVRDYGRIYGMPTMVFRQSCIYGPRQFGVEDQGWVAWLLIAGLLGRPIKVFGTGHQTRDLLDVDDLVAAYVTAASRANELVGEVFNLGGGVRNQLSLVELLARMPALLGTDPIYEFAPLRPGDQPLFVADTSKAERLLDWTATVGVDQGLERLASWIRENRSEIESLLAVGAAL